MKVKFIKKPAQKTKKIRNPVLKDYEKIRTLSYQKDFSLKPIRALLNLLENPQNALAFIHVAGTKGKTSVCHYLSHLALECHETPVGLYTSPHLESVAERIQINGEPVSESLIDEKVTLIQKLAKENQLELTFFETLTAAAFLIFTEKKVKLVILETGLGGRLDATNTVFPLLSVITPIDKDHTELLGHSLFSIAREKGGILKPGTPFLLGTQKKRIFWFLRLLGIIKKARFCPGIKFEIQILSPSSFLLQSPEIKRIYHGPAYGAANFALALNAARQAGMPLKPSGEFFHQVPGRFEVYQKEKSLLVIDGAHNPFSAEKLVQALKTAFPDQNWIFILNAFKDKDIQGMVAVFTPLAKEFWVVKDPRFDSDQTLKAVQKSRKPFKLISLSDLSGIQGENFCVTGSFYLAGDFKKQILPQTGFIKKDSGYKFFG